MRVRSKQRGGGIVSDVIEKLRKGAKVRLPYKEDWSLISDEEVGVEEAAVERECDEQEQLAADAWIRESFGYPR